MTSRTRQASKQAFIAVKMRLPRIGLFDQLSFQAINLQFGQKHSSSGLLHQFFINWQKI